jgi:hypothetical protein
MLPHGQRGTRERFQCDGFAFAVKESIELGAAAVHAACKFRFRDVFTLHEFIESLGQLMQNALRELIGAVLKRKVQPTAVRLPKVGESNPQVLDGSIAPIALRRNHPCTGTASCHQPLGVGLDIDHRHRSAKLEL